MTTWKKLFRDTDSRAERSFRDIVDRNSGDDTMELVYSTLAMVSLCRASFSHVRVSRMLIMPAMQALHIQPLHTFVPSSSYPSHYPPSSPSQHSS
jgi:hypothetical protein